MDDVNLLYDVSNGETFGILIAVYFYLTGLSAGSFVLSTLAYAFGIERYRPLGKPGILLATILLIISPLFLLLHVGKPLRSWHLFVYLNLSSPISWGSFLLTLYPINCIIYGWFMFKGKQKQTRMFGIIGIPLAIAVHGYTGFILAFGKGRALWNSSIMPLLFLVSAIVSGIALMILVCIIKDKFFTPEKRVNQKLIFDLAKLLGWCLIFDLFLTACEVSTHLVSHKDSIASTLLLLTGNFSPFFVGVETVLGKILPLFVIFIPRIRSVPTIAVSALLVVVGIFAMRCNVVLGGEFIPLL